MSHFIPLAERCYAECRYAECHYDECRGAKEGLPPSYFARGAIEEIV